MRIESLDDSYNKWVKIFPTPKRIKGGRDGQELPDEEHDWVLGNVVDDMLPIDNRTRHFCSAVRLEDIDRLDEYGCLWLRVQIKMSGDDLWFEPLSRPLSSPDAARLLQYREPHVSETKMFAPAPELDWNEYGNAYSNAAKLMARTASGDVTSMPVVFLYRHAIELKTKGIIVTFGNPTPDERAELYKSHKLLKPLRRLMAIAERVGHTVSEHFQTMVNRFHNDDIDGMRARFPRDKADKNHLIEHGNSYYVRVFAGECDQVLVELDELFAALDKCAGDDYERSIVGDTTTD